MFNIMVKNEGFISFCNYVDTSWLKYLIGTLVYVPSTYLLYLCLTKQEIGKDWWLMLICLPASFLKDKVLVLGTIIDILVMVVIPLLRCKCKNWLRLIVSLCILFGYQTLMLLLRNLHLFFEGNNTTLMGLIMNIDYYIIILICYLYGNRELFVKEN